METTRLTVYLEDIAKNSEYGWHNVFEVLEKVLLDFTDIDKIIIFTEVVIDHMTKSGFNNPVFVARTIDLLCASRDLKFKVNELNFQPDVLKALFVEAMTTSFRMRRRSYYFYFCPALEYEQVGRALYTGDAELMKVLVRNGMSYHFSKHESDAILEKMGIIMLLQERDVSDPFTYHRLADTADEIFDTLVENNFRRNGRPFLIPENFANRKRGLLILGALQMILHQHKIDQVAVDHFVHPSRNYAKCLKLFFQTIPEPLLTFDEVGLLLKGAIPKERQSTSDNLFEFYKEVFPESETKYQPRALKHLCRCQVRFDLRRFGVLEYHVNHLDIPYTLKSFLLADSDEITN